MITPLRERLEYLKKCRLLQIFDLCFHSIIGSIFGSPPYPAPLCFCSCPPHPPGPCVNGKEETSVPLSKPELLIFQILLFRILLFSLSMMVMMLEGEKWKFRYEILKKFALFEQKLIHCLEVFLQKWIKLVLLIILNFIRFKSTIHRNKTLWYTL